MGLEKEMSTDELDPENPDDLYTLVLKKFLSPEIIWKKGGTQIYLRLTEKDGLVAVMIDYIPIIFSNGKRIVLKEWQPLILSHH